MDANSRYILDKITQINIDTTLVVDQAYIDTRDNIKVKTYQNNNGNDDRDDNQKKLDIDCEWADQIVLNSGKDYILNPTVTDHDFRIKKEPENVIWCVDNKVVHNDIFYIHEGFKYEKYLKSYRKGLLHYFAFWRFLQRPTKPFELGFKPELETLSVIPAGIVLEKMCDPRNKTQKPDKNGLCKYIVRVL